MLRRRAWCPGRRTRAPICSPRCASWWWSPPTTRRPASRRCCAASARSCPRARSWWSTTTAPTGPAALVAGRRGRRSPTCRSCADRRRPGSAAPTWPASRRGWRRGFDILVEMDADLSHDPVALPALVSAAVHGADLAIGSRYVRGGSIPDWTRRRAFLSRWGNRYAALALGLAVNDSTSGYRAYRRRGARRAGPRPRPGLRLRVPGGDDVPPDPRGREGGRDPGRLRGSPGWRVEDVAAHRRRGVRAGDRVGGA